MPHKLSKRGQQLVDSPPLAEYIGAHFERATRAWDRETAPDGYIALCIAENRQMWDEVSARLARVKDVPQRVLGYDAMTGSLAFREKLAAFMSRSFLGRSIAPENLAVAAGAGSVLELLFYALCDPGDGVLVPTPSYAGFWADLETRDALTIVPVHRTAADDYRLTTDALDQAVARASCPVKALLFTSPDNPLGRVYDRSDLEEVLAWSERAGIHVVFDEIYALSVFGETPFVSAASLRPTLGELVHTVWAFSKDFGASGLRCGVLASENADVLRAVDGLAYWSACSGHTQYLLGELVCDARWVDDYLTQMRHRLGTTHAAVTSALAQQNIPFVKAQGGFFVMCDLRGFLPAQTWQAEAMLWRRILDEGNVNLTPGSACRAPEPGLFRLCYASEPVDAVREGVRRITAVLKSDG